MNHAIELGLQTDPHPHTLISSRSKTFTLRSTVSSAHTQTPQRGTHTCCCGSPLRLIPHSIMEEPQECGRSKRLARLPHGEVWGRRRPRRTKTLLSDLDVIERTVWTKGKGIKLRQKTVIDYLCKWCKYWSFFNTLLLKSVETSRVKSSGLIELTQAPLLVGWR